MDFCAAEDKPRFASMIFYKEGDGFKTWCDLVIAADYLGYDKLQHMLSKVFAEETMNKTVAELERIAGKQFTEEERAFVKENVRWTTTSENFIPYGVDDLVGVLTGHSPNNALQFVKSCMRGRCLSVRSSNRAAECGHLEVVGDLRARGVHSRSWGADNAAENGHLEIVRDLRAHGIHCTEEGANLAAEKGNLGVVRNLRSRDVHCTKEGADWAAGRGHPEVVRDLRAHGIDCTHWGADWAAEKGNLEVVQDLRAHGIHCTGWGADYAAELGDAPRLTSAWHPLHV